MTGLSSLEFALHGTQRLPCREDGLSLLYRWVISILLKHMQLLFLVTYTRHLDRNVIMSIDNNLKPVLTELTQGSAYHLLSHMAVNTTNNATAVAKHGIGLDNVDHCGRRGWSYDAQATPPKLQTRAHPVFLQRLRDFMSTPYLCFLFYNFH